MSPKKTRRIIYGAFLAFVLFAVSGNTLYFWRDRNIEMANVLQRRRAAAHFTALLLNERFSRMTDVAVSLSTRVQFRKAVKERRWDDAIAILSSVPKDFPFIERVFIADQKGVLMADVPELPGARGKDFSRRDWYAGVQRTGKAYVSEVYKRSAEP